MGFPRRAERRGAGEIRDECGREGCGRAGGGSGNGERGRKLGGCEEIRDAIGAGVGTRI